MNQRRKRNKYTKGSKGDAIKLVLQHNDRANEVLRRFRINQTSMFRWAREYGHEHEPPVDSTVSRSELEVEVNHLIKEKQRLQIEREILKRAMAIFANEPK